MTWMMESPQWPLEDKLFHGGKVTTTFLHTLGRLITNFNVKRCLICMCVYLCVCVCTRNTFFLSSNACWNVYNPSSIYIYLHDGAGRFTVLSFISFILSVYRCRRQLWYDNVCPGYSQQQLGNYFCSPFSPFSPLIYILHPQTLARVCFLMGGVSRVVLGWFSFVDLWTTCKKKKEKRFPTESLVEFSYANNLGSTSPVFQIIHLVSPPRKMNGMSSAVAMVMKKFFKKCRKDFNRNVWL